MICLQWIHQSNSLTNFKTEKVASVLGWKSCTFSFPDFVAMTQNPLLPDSHSEEFSVPSLDDFVGDDIDELLMCPIRALRKYQSRMEQYRPGIEGLFISMGRRKKRVSRNTISFWLLSLISMAHTSAPVEDCCSLRVRVHEVRKVATSLLLNLSAPALFLAKCKSFF